MAGAQKLFNCFQGLLISIFCGGPAVNAAALDQWQSANPLPKAERLTAVSYGNGLWVAVGANGTLVTSPDGINWTPRASGVSSSVWTISHGNGQWVAPAIGQPASIVFLTSSDGIAWTKRISGEKFGLYAIGYGDGQWVAVGENGKLLSSPDGIHWSARISGTQKHLFGISHGNGRWVAVGDEGLIISSGETGTPPELAITVGERNAFVSWAADVAGFALESTTNPAASQSWTVITNLPTVLNSKQTIIDSLSAPARFYRLRKE